MTFDPGNRLIVALDVPTGNDALNLVEQLDGAASFVKVGLQLFIAEGTKMVEELIRMNLRIMLDLKLHDIPNTVKEAAKQCAGLGAELITVHASGGAKMLEAAVEGAGDASVLAVTVLTSLDVYDLQEVSGTKWSVRDTVLKRIYLAEEAGCFGIVASPHEASMLKYNEHLRKKLKIVCPGIRLAGSDTQDQKRVMTPSEAREAGADLIVVGRPIRNAEDPAATARAIAVDLSGRSG